MSSWYFHSLTHRPAHSSCVLVVTEVLGSWDNGYPRGDFSFEEQTLHKKKTGEYFVYASGGAQSNFGDCYGGHDCSGEKFIPMSVEQAQQWSEEYLTVEKYVEIWGEPEE